MRRASFILVGVAAAIVTVGYGLVRMPIPSPDIALDIEPACVEAMRRSPPDQTWNAPVVDAVTRLGKLPTLGYGQLSSSGGKAVRVAGVLHVEFEWVALYRSFEDMRTDVGQGGPAASWVSLGTLWPNEPFWLTKSSLISDRCAVVEGTFDALSGGHMGMFRGAIQEVRRLEVWSLPHRPFVPHAVWPLPPTAREASRQALAAIRNAVEHGEETDRALATVTARPEHRQALVDAIGSGEDAWLEIAGTAMTRPDQSVAPLLRRGIQIAVYTSPQAVLRFVSRGTIAIRDACGPNALPPGADAASATYYAVRWVDMRIDGVSRVDEPDLGALAAECEKELRRERHAVLADEAK